MGELGVSLEGRRKMCGEKVWMEELGKVALLVCAIAALAVCVEEAGADDGSSKARVLEGHEGAILDAVISSDGRRLASGGSDGTVRVWDLALGKELVCLKGHEGAVAHVVFTRDGSKILSGGEDGSVRLWDATTGKQLDCLEGAPGCVSKLVVTRNGRRAIVCGTGLR